MRMKRVSLLLLWSVLVGAAADHAWGAAPEIPAELETAVQRARYAIGEAGAEQVPQATNYSQQLRVRFEKDGASVTLRQPSDDAALPLSMRLVAWGVDGSLTPAATPFRSATAARVDYRYGRITEWWKNSAAGLEHGFDVQERPHGDRARPLVLQMRLGRGWRARQLATGLLLEGSRGERLAYDKLVTRDASGRTVSGRLEPTQSGFSLIVEDAGAVYPLTIDPIVTNLEAKLEGTSFGGEVNTAFGGAISLSGNTVLVGAPVEDARGAMNVGAVYVFLRNGTGWTQQARLVAPNPEADGRFGRAISVSGDTAVIGGTRTAHVFVRNGTTWTHQMQLVVPGLATTSGFGISVSLSGDTAIVGAYQDDTAPNGQGGSAYVFVRSGGSWTQQARLVPTDFGRSDFFGYAVAVSGDTAVIGAYHDDTSIGADAGSAYVFVRSGTSWTQQAQLLPPSGAAQDEFGIAVAVHGETAVVGAHLANRPGAADAGSAYVFVRQGTSWPLQAQLLASDGDYKDQFGAAVAVSGDTAVIGAFADDTAAGLGVGSAYVFTRTGTSWTQQTQLLAPIGEPQDQFGVSVAVDGDTTVVGANLDNTPGGPDSGSGYVFLREGVSWPLQAQLFATKAPNYQGLGCSVSISGDTAVVGACADSAGGGYLAGTAYVFVRNGNGWTQQARLYASDAFDYDNFGYSVAVDGNTAVVGALDGDTARGFNTGSAYVFVRSGTTWTQQAKLVASDGAPRDRFGGSVTVSGDTVVVAAGAGTQMIGGTDLGRVYVFVRDGATWSERAILRPPDLAASGVFGASVSLAGDTLVVGASGDDTPAATSAGSAHVFVRSGDSWTRQGRLVAADAMTSDRFGRSVSISGDTVVVGAINVDASALSNAGAAYVFVRNGTAWTQQAQLRASDAAAYDYFGSAVAVSGDTIVVGSPSDDTARGIQGGSAYLFRRNGTTWTEEGHFISEGELNDYFASEVAVSGDTIVVGASNQDTAAYDDTGSAYVYRVRTVTAGISVLPSAGLTTTEGGGTASFNIVLESQPTGDVTVALSSSDTTEAVVTPSSVTFTSANYNVARTVTVTGVDDSIIDGNIGYTIVTAPATSTDSSYNGFNAADVSGTNSDNDTAGVTVTPTGGLVTTETGGSATFTVVLRSQPAADVTITFSSSDTTEGTVVPASVTFNAGNYSTARSVTVVGVDDQLADGNVAYTIVTAPLTSTDGNYANLDPVDVSVTNSDDDMPTVTFDPVTYWRNENAGSVTLTVTRRGIDLSIPSSVDYAPGPGTARAGRWVPSSGTLNFGPGETSRTFAISLVDDSTNDGRQDFTIRLTNAQHALLGAATATVNLTDDDATASDFNFPLDGYADLVWRNESTGDTKVWRMNGTSVSSTVDLLRLGDGWNLQGVADFDADGSADLLYRSSVDQAFRIWYMSGTGILRTGSIPTVTDTNWKIVGLGDLNGDGYPDLLWRHTNFHLAVWLMRDDALLSAYALPTVTDNNWQVKGLGDFNRDGQLDIVWRHGPTSSTAVWFLTPGGTALASAVTITAAGAPWDIVGVGDLNRDGDSDVIWQSTTTRTLAVWLMNRTTATSIIPMPTMSDPNWKVVSPR